MNKIIVVVCIFTIAFISFTVGYKYGDSNGYDAGYTEGYRYDCRAEIASLYEQVKAQRKVSEFARESVKNILRENDSLKNPSKARQRYLDSIAWREQYSRDSVTNYKMARHKNDSIASITGALYNYYGDDGKFNPMTCISGNNVDIIKECASHRNFVKMFKDAKNRR